MRPHKTPDGIPALRLGKLKAHFLSGDVGAVFRGMATLAFGNLLARMVGVISLPILTRLYAPDDFGAMAVFNALILMLAPFMTLRYALAIPLPRHDGLALNLMALSAGILVVSGSILALILAYFAEPLLALLSMTVLAPWWWLIVLGLFGTSSYELLSLWATRRRAYRAIARTKLTQSLAGMAVKLGFGAAAPGPLGLIMGQVVAYSGGIGALLRQFSGELSRNWRHVRWSRVRRVAARYRGFPIYRLPSQLLLVFSQQAPLMFAATLFGSTTAGQLGLALSALALPVSLLGGSVSNALYGEAASIGMREPARLLRLVRTTQVRLFALALAPAIGLFFFGPMLFRLVFGSEWETAGHFASLLSVYLLFQFTSAPLMQMMNLLDAQEIFLVINSLRAMLILMLMLTASYLGQTPSHFVGTYSAAMALIYLGMSAWVIQRLSARAQGSEK